MRSSRRLSTQLAPLAAALAVAVGCRPVGVVEGGTSIADITARRPQAAALDILGIGTQREDGRIVLRSTGAVVSRGTTVTVGVMGPGMEEGTGFAVVGLEFVTRIVRFAMTEGGGVASMPAAVLSIDVPPSVRPGLYSIAAIRGSEYAIFSGGLEVH